MMGLLRHFVRAFRDMSTHAWAHMFTVMVVTMVSILAGVFLLLLHNVNQELMKSRGKVEFQMFWRVGLDASEVEADWRHIAAMPDLAGLLAYTPDQALDELAKSLESGASLTWLEGRNPLPASATAAFSLPPRDDGGVWAQGILVELRDLPGVDEVHYNPLQMDMAQSWMRIAHTVIWPLIGFMGVVVALVVGNTVKLSLIARRDEVEILYLVGATPGYIRAPLLISGMLMGLTGSGLALGLLKLGQMRLADVLNFPPVFLRIEFLPLQQAAILAGTALMVCMVSSWVAVRR